MAVTPWMNETPPTPSDHHAFAMERSEERQNLGVDGVPLAPRLGAEDRTDYLNGDRFEVSRDVHQEAVKREERERRAYEAFRALSLEEREKMLGFDSEGNVKDA